MGRLTGTQTIGEPTALSGAGIADDASSVRRDQTTGLRSGEASDPLVLSDAQPDGSTTDETTLPSGPPRSSP